MEIMTYNQDKRKFLKTKSPFSPASLTKLEIPSADQSAIIEVNPSPFLSQLVQAEIDSARDKPKKTLHPIMIGSAEGKENLN